MAELKQAQPSQNYRVNKFFAAMSVDSKAYFNQRMVFLRSFNFKYFLVFCYKNPT